MKKTIEKSNIMAKMYINISRHFDSDIRIPRWDMYSTNLPDDYVPEQNTTKSDMTSFDVER